MLLFYCAKGNFAMMNLQKKIRLFYEHQAEIVGLVAVRFHYFYLKAVFAGSSIYVYPAGLH